jgi:Protein of unknown function (DUF4238)
VSAEPAAGHKLGGDPEEYEIHATDDDPGTMEEWAEKHFPGLIENFGMSLFHKLVDSPLIGQKLVSLRWFLWDFSKAKHELLIGDHPCIFLGGIDDADLTIALPISPRKAFFAARGDGEIYVLRQATPTQLAARLNELSISQARARVYATTRSPGRFVRNRVPREPVAR